jgi:hypothetical protein
MLISNEKDPKKFTTRWSAHDVESQVRDASLTYGLGRQTSGGNATELTSRGVRGTLIRLLYLSRIPVYHKFDNFLHSLVKSLSFIEPPKSTSEK